MIEEQNIGMFKTRVWQVCSHIRGLMPDIQLQQVAVAFTFLRRIDCLIGQYAKECFLFYSKNKENLSDERLDKKLREISGGYPFYNYSGYSFTELLRANNSLNVVLNTYLQGFSQNILEILEGMNFKQNIAILQRQSRYVVELFRSFSEIALSSSVVDNEEFVGLVSSLLSMNNREIGFSLTPWDLSNLICECLLSRDLRDCKDENTAIYDPVCGTGSMLAVAGEKAKRFAIHQNKISLYGQEVSIFPCAIAKALALLIGNEDSRVIYGNTLTEDLFPENHFQYILADLPLGLQWKPIKERIEKEWRDSNGRFYMGLPSTNDSQFLFIEHIISKMDLRGSRAAFITSSSVLVGGAVSSGESRIRRWLFEHDMVETIIALPEGTLPRTKASIFLWILTNNKNEAQKGYVHLIDASAFKDINRPDFNKTLIKSIIAEYRNDSVSTMSIIVKNEQFGFYEIGLLEDGKKKEIIKIPLDVDINEYIQNELQPFAKGIVTIDYSSVEKGYMVSFDKFFKPKCPEIKPLNFASQEILSVLDFINSIRIDIESARHLYENKSTSELWGWRELPMRSFIDIVNAGNKPSILAKDGLPLLSVSYLRKKSDDNNLYAITSKTKCSTAKDVLIIMKGDYSGEVFRGIDGILSSYIAALKCKNEDVISPQYLYFLLKGYEKTIMIKAKKQTTNSLDIQSILDIKCLIPPIEEQHKILFYLNNFVEKIDLIINRFKNAENVFTEYRQILIENVIQGKVVVKY